MNGFADFFTAANMSALLTIIVIDLVLAGDNAIVIGLAARNLPKQLQKRAILYGTAGAIVIRIIATVLVVWLLKIPGLLVVGGVLLIWIAYRLLVEKKKHDHVGSAQTIWGAIRTIILADAVMGLDNVLAIAGAAHGNIVLVVIGLLISVPIIIWGSTLIIGWIERFPAIIYIGAGVLAFTAGKMIAGEPLLADVFGGRPLWKWSLIVLLILGVVGVGWYRNQERQPAR